MKSLSSSDASLASSSSVRSRACLSGSTPVRWHKNPGQVRADSVDVLQRIKRVLVVGDVNAENTRHPYDLRRFNSARFASWPGMASRHRPVSPAVACGGGWCKSRTPYPLGARSCSSHRYASRSIELSYLFKSHRMTDVGQSPAAIAISRTISLSPGPNFVTILTAMPIRKSGGHEIRL